VREVALEAIERARRGDGPTLIEAETYRFRGHSLADPDELRSKEEKAAYAVRGCVMHSIPHYKLAESACVARGRRQHTRCVAHTASCTSSAVHRGPSQLWATTVSAWLLQLLRVACCEV
jgi:TPP-dependent pyruvate/acetoin dehydrogenase alpha subunit